MASSTEFSRTLSLLRQERGVSQRTAAADLGISQALLSHYENGIREPGLAFVVRACDYYHVSADFILGRTLSREGNMLTEQEILNAAEPGNILQGSVLATLQSKLLSGAVSVLFGLLGKLNDKAAINAAAGYLGSAVYQALPPSVPGRRRQRVLLFPGRRRLPPWARRRRTESSPSSGTPAPSGSWRRRRRNSRISPTRPSTPPIRGRARA